MNILDYYERKAFILKSFEAGNISGREALERLREINREASNAGLSVSDVINAETLLDVRSDSELSYSEETDEYEDESFDSSYSYC